VQTAKLVHRLASGTHKVWLVTPGDATEMYVYPASRGRLLRNLGKTLQRGVELLCDRAVRDILGEVISVRVPDRSRDRQVEERCLSILRH
jgi:hypothetical protein